MLFRSGFDLTIPTTLRAIVDEAIDNVMPADIQVHYAPRNVSKKAEEEAKKAAASASKSSGSKKKGDKAPFEAGAHVLVVVKKVDRAEKKISLALADENAVVGSIVTEQKVAIGSVVKATVERIETYGVFVQVEGMRGKAGRGLIPVSETGTQRGTDLRKAFPEGSEVRAKVLETGDGKLKLSLKAAKDADERADFEQAKAKGAAPKSLGTLGDLLKNFKK